VQDGRRPGSDQQAAYYTPYFETFLRDILRAHTFDFIYKCPHRLAHQVQSVLAKLELCRTKALGGHVYRCRQCDFELPVYNSCRDRHCPLCRGGRRADWLDKTKELLLPGLHYFQVVFTLPGQLASFSLGNRRKIFGLLMLAAWQGLNQVLRDKFGVQPAASLVLHTWNQELDVHPHAHALVPGGFPSLDGRRWIVPKHPKHQRRRKPYLCDVFELSQAFREKFMAGLRRLYRREELKFESESDAEPEAFEAWAKELEELDWNVHIEGPPNEQSDPSQLAKYLTRYMTGGPISDARLISADDDEIWFWARRCGGKHKSKKNRPRPFRLTARQFMLRWAQHILPRGFIKSRCYGGYHNTKRADYLELCRSLLGNHQPETTPDAVAPPPDESTTSEKRCPNCQAVLVHHEKPRPSWRKVLAGEYRPDWYYGFLGMRFRAMPWYRDGY
jgi:hypothetical protein